ncbi:MAG: type II toxin-antitoxin system RatA family toxin [Pseudomonadota bacterium]
MTTHHERSFVPFTPQQMFALVADVEDYPSFIPWVEALRVRSRQGDHQLTADMVVKYKIFRESFRSQVDFNLSEHIIDVTYIRGPLKTLTNQWKFLSDSKGCIVDFSIGFEFKNKLMQVAANQLIEHAFKRLSGSFIEEAHRRYAPISLSDS